MRKYVEFKMFIRCLLDKKISVNCFVNFKVLKGLRMFVHVSLRGRPDGGGNYWSDGTVVD